MRPALALAALAAVSAACAGGPGAGSASLAPSLRFAAPAPAAAAVPEAEPRLEPPFAAAGAGIRSLSGATARQNGGGASVERRFEQAVVEPEVTRAIVLLYHAFDRGNEPLSLPRTRFERHLKWLSDNDVEIVALSELIDFLVGKTKLPARVAVITIDDGVRSVYEKAWPILLEHRARFTLGLPTYYMQAPKGLPMLSWDQVREMQASGLCELASHGHRHRALTVVSGRLLFEELELSRRIIQENTGSTPEAYFYPLGALDKNAMRNVVKAGYRAAFSAIGAPIAVGSSPLMRVPRTTIFHDDDVGKLAYYFSERFMRRLPDTRRAPAEPMLAARENPRSANASASLDRE